MSREDDARRLLYAMNDVSDGYIDEAMKPGISGTVPGPEERPGGHEAEAGVENEAEKSAEDAHAGKSDRTRRRRVVRFRRTAGIAAAIAACCVVALVGRNLMGSGFGSARSGAGFTENTSSQAVMMNSSNNLSEEAAEEEATDVTSAGFSNSSDLAWNETDEAAESASEAQNIAKKIVYSGNITLETRDYDAAKQQLSDMISGYGGFVESSNEYDNGSQTQSERSYYVTLRIPASSFDAFMSGVGDIDGKVTSKNVTSSDMTRTYSDNADRIEALETEQEALLELLSKADSVDAMIAIQNELADIRAELAQLYHANSGIDYDVQYSTVSINLDEVVTYSPERVSFTDRVRDAAAEAGAAFISFLQGVVIAVIFIAPYAVIAVVIFLIVRAVRRKRAAGKAEDRSKK